MTLLPRKFDPTGTYRNARSVHLRTLSFRLFIHAEIESYLEDASQELANLGWKAWQAGGLATRVTQGMLAYSELSTSKPPRKLGGDSTNQKAYDDMSVVLGRANSAWRNAHKNNHGIKEESVLALLLPLGLDSDVLDTTLLADLSSYGGARGEVAHKSVLSVSVLADPKAEFEKARSLVKDLEKLDKALSSSITSVKALARAAKVPL